MRGRNGLAELGIYLDCPMIDAGAVRGRKMTSYHSIQMDLKNAGENSIDQEFTERIHVPQR
jgi:putative intracellular protease/amidase